MKHFITILLIGVATLGFSQDGKLNKDTTNFSKSPLYVVQLEGDTNYHTVMPELSMVTPKNVKQMEILKDEPAITKFHERGKNGVIVITVKKETELLTEDELFDEFNIQKKLESLPLFLNNHIIAKSRDMVFTLSKIKSVSVAKEKGTSLKYISIITTDDSKSTHHTTHKIHHSITAGRRG